MHYERGSILTKHNVVFKGTQRLDFRMGGHPVLLPLEFSFDKDHLYFFTLSSQTQYYISDPERYYLLSSGNGSGLKKPSIVDLMYVYKCDRYNAVPHGVLNDRDMNNLVRQFLNYDSRVIDADCGELIQLIS